MDESGRVSTDDVFAVGLLIVRNPAWLKAIIQSVREEYHYFSEFHLTDLHRGNFAVYQLLLQRVFSHFDTPRARRHLRFRTVCVLGKTLIRRTQKEHTAYNYYVEWALRHNLKNDMQGAVLYLDQKSRYDKDHLLDRLQLMADTQRPGTIKKVEEIDSARSDFLQLCDILTGLVRFGNLMEHRLIHTQQLESSRGRLKAQLWQFLKPYYGKGNPIICHQIKSGIYTALQGKYHTTP